jgi:hypothetical protein
MAKIFRSNKGITLVESLIALLLAGIITAAMFKVYVNQHHAWMIQDSVIEMQQNARAAIDELTRQLRMTGYALPNGLAPLQAYDTDPDTIVILYETGTGCNAPIEHDMPQPSAELRCDGHDVSCFYDGQDAFIYDPNLESGEFFTVTHVQVGSSHIQHSLAPLSRSYPQGSLVLSIDRVKYYIDYSDTLHPRLMIQVGNASPQVYAEDIVDLQFDYTLKNGITLSQPPSAMARDIRQIAITINARTPKPDVEFEQNPYRYETYQSKVFLRNL